MHGKDSWIIGELRRSGVKTGLSAVRRIFEGRLKGVDDLAKCALCPNMCRFTCPVSIVDGRETTSPAGKARIALFIKRGFLEFNAENVEPLYHCLSCDSCREWCPFQFSVSELTLHVREQSSSMMLLPRGLREVIDNLERYRNIFGKAQDDSIQGGGGNVLYLRGCMVREYYPELAGKTVKVLGWLGYKAYTPEVEACCGLIAYESGAVRLARRIAVENARLLNQQEAKLIVTSCPSCAYAYRVVYPKLGVKIKRRVQCTAEFLMENLKRATAKEKVEVVIHDPCRLARGLGRPKALKMILDMIEGLEVKVPVRSGANTFCCGYGGTLSKVKPRLSQEIAGERIHELRVKAETIVTACPTCKWALTEAGGKAVDIVELLDSLELS